MNKNQKWNECINDNEIRWEVAGKEKDLRKEKTQIMINEYKKKREKEGKAVPEEDENKNRW